MFTKVLIANRGEIALRVQRTCRRLGIATLAVHSDVDAGQPFATEADEAVCIGPGPVAQSYLRGDEILRVALERGASAIHPGYGLLSENAAFADSVEASGLVFIGPRSESIRQMGSKVAAREIARNAGLRLVPGSPALESLEQGALEAERIGFPLLVKASAGGGGIGMTRVKKPKKLEQALREAMDKGERFFGDSTVFLEKLIESPHHVEVQLLGDGSGKVLHLGDRECSLQRRHQKLLEEAPGPFLNSAQRQDLCARAVSLAQSINYRGAGTVEFVADRDGNFYFLEMNTRLQVEHTVSEAIYGIDLVEWQLRIAAGEELSLEQHDLIPQGHALEFRICAEDPSRKFAPSPGRLERWCPPAEGPGLRLDSGVTQGSEVSPYYDSLLAKLIVHGADRAQAIARAREALEQFEVVGISTTIGFHRQVLEQPEFLAGNYSTDLSKEMLRL
jgi:acetyl-CoA carboxylase biotin carboxylase subunit